MAKGRGKVSDVPDLGASQLSELMFTEGKVFFFSSKIKIASPSCMSVSLYVCTCL